MTAGTYAPQYLAPDQVIQVKGFFRTHGPKMQIEHPMFGVIVVTIRTIPESKVTQMRMLRSMIEEAFNHTVAVGFMVITYNDEFLFKVVGLRTRSTTHSQPVEFRIEL